MSFDPKSFYQEIINLFLFNSEQMEMASWILIWKLHWFYLVIVIIENAIIIRSILIPDLFIRKHDTTFECIILQLLSFSIRICLLAHLHLACFVWKSYITRSGYVPLFNSYMNWGKFTNNSAIFPFRICTVYQFGSMCCSLRVDIRPIRPTLSLE